jgi:hypothetical protein
MLNWKSCPLVGSCALIGVLMAPAIALSGPVLISRKSAEPRVVDVPFCYMTTAGGQLLNLNQICEGTSTSKQIVKEDVVVTDLKFTGNRVTGRVKNNTNRPVTAVVINYAIASSDLEQSDAGAVLLEQSTLQPQQEGTFRADLPNPGQVKVTSVDWIPAN